MIESLIQKIDLPVSNISLYIKREDLIHPIVSGNKFRKLKYNLIQAKEESATTLLSFGGAYSNHIAALAFAGKENGFRTIGVIRGEELSSQIDENPTLSFAKSCGMVFQFVSREDYRMKKESFFLESLKQKYGDFYLVPEGGTNEFAIKGCEEILNENDSEFDFICCGIGTGGTISGIINSALPRQKVLGFPALKGDFIRDDIRKFVVSDNWDLITDYHFGGFGKISADLVLFMNQFYKENLILLDPVYTGKMAYGLMDLIKKNYFPENSKILMIHTGGIQGIEGMNKVLTKKQLPLINVQI